MAMQVTEVQLPRGDSGQPPNPQISQRLHNNEENESAAVGATRRPRKAGGRRERLHCDEMAAPSL